MIKQRNAHPRTIYLDNVQLEEAAGLEGKSVDDFVEAIQEKYGVLVEVLSVPSVPDLENATKALKKVRAKPEKSVFRADGKRKKRGAQKGSKFF